MNGVLGIAYPFRFSKAGGVSQSVANDLDTARFGESIVQILLTRPGERKHEPEFGSRLSALAFANLGSGTEPMVRNEVRRVLARWEPRVEVVSTRAVVDKSLIRIEILYRSKLTGIDQSLTVTLETGA